MQKWYIDAQNLVYSSRDRTRTRLAELYHVLPRSYDELRRQMEGIGLLVEALKRATSTPGGGEEGGAMRTFVRIQLSTEYQKGYNTYGAQVASSSALNDMCKQDESNPRCLLFEYVSEKLEWTWRRIGADAKEVTDGAARAILQAHTSTVPISLDATQKALVASAAPIVAEKAAVKCTGAGPTGSGTLL